MKRTSGATNLAALMSVVSFMGLDLVAIRLGFGRSLRLVRSLWATVPPASTLGLALGAVSLMALMLTMWRISRASAAPTRHSRAR